MSRRCRVGQEGGGEAGVLTVERRGGDKGVVKGRKGGRGWRKVKKKFEARGRR